MRHSSVSFQVVLAMLALVSAEDKTEEQAVAPVADQETAAGHYGYWGYPAWGHRYGYYPGHHYGWAPARYGYGYNTPGSYARVARHRRSVEDQEVSEHKRKRYHGKGHYGRYGRSVEAAEEPTATAAVETVDQAPEEHYYGPYYGRYHGAYYGGWPHHYNAYNYGSYAPYGHHTYNYRHY